MESNLPPRLLVKGIIVSFEGSPSVTCYFETLIAKENAFWNSYFLLGFLLNEPITSSDYKTLSVNI